MDRRRRVPSLALVLALALGAPVSATEQDPASRGEEPTHRLRHLVSSDGRSSPLVPTAREVLTDKFSSIERMTDRATFVDGTRALIEQAWGITLPRPRRDEGPGAETRNDHGSEEFTERYSHPSGDLDGDGREDLLVSEVTYSPDPSDGYPVQTSHLLHAFRGTDGAPFWKRDASGTADETIVIPSDDLDADGAADLLLLNVTFEDEDACGVRCAYAPLLRYRWDLHRIDGRTGTSAWTTTYPGELVAGGGIYFAMVAAAGAAVYSGTNVAVLPLIADDHDGDGVKDVAMNTLDLVYSFGGAATIGAAAIAVVVATQTRAALLDGALGGALLTRDSGWNAGIATLVPVGQAVGSARGDLRWTAETAPVIGQPCALVLDAGVCEPVLPSSLAIEMIDGSTLTTAWKTRRDQPDANYADATLFGEDLTGDGTSDVLVVEYVRGGGARMAAVSGTDGSEVWRRPILGPLTLLGDVGGGPGADLLHGWYSDDWQSVTLARIDGGTGEEILRSELDAHEDGAILIVSWSVMNDADGDGGADLALGVTDWGDEEDRSRAIIESGSTGAVLLERAATYLSPAGDLDGDGLADVIETNYRYDAGWSFETAAWSPQAQEQRWQRVDRLNGDAWVVPTPIGDTDGDGADDMAYDRIQTPHESLTESRVDVLDGRTGLARWGFGAELTPPPGPAGIAGTVRDTRGIPVADICVTAYRVVVFDEDRFAFSSQAATTDADGRYSLWLLPDTYAVRFARCDDWRGIWWDGKTTLDEADLIELAPGMIKEDVDATLPGHAVENDASSDAIDIWTEPFGHRIDTRRATVEPGEATPCESGATVWYRFTASSAHTFLAETRMSDYDTTIAVYTGSSTDDLTFVECVNDTASNQQAELTIAAQTGLTYWFQVGGFRGATGDLRFRFRSMDQAGALRRPDAFSP